MKGFASSYLIRQKCPASLIPDPVSEKTGFIVVIPVLCEPDITQTLESLRRCTRPAQNTEVLLVINTPENASRDILECNQKTLITADRWIKEHPDDRLRFFILNETLPSRDAGVGLARKIGMDEAVRRFDRIGKNDGFILSFDADSICDQDYFTAIESTIRKKPATKGFDIYFEHPVSGSQYPETIYRGITRYELHLRYVNLYLNYSGFPYARHTVGSCFGVRADIYAAQGGMNKRKGGEDFYFLHKIIPLGDFEVINSTRIIPSPRDSMRVPFGTGPVIRKYIETGSEILTYRPESFRVLKEFFNRIHLFYRNDNKGILVLIDPLHDSMKQFLIINNYIESIDEINRNSASEETFRNRFFRWFDAFKVIKYLNYSAMHFFPKLPVTSATQGLLKDMGIETPDKNDALELLLKLRQIERAMTM